MTNQVSVFAFDQDVVAVAGTVGYAVNTNARFNGYFYNSTGTNSDQLKITRFFSKGGLYKVRWIHLSGTNTAKVDIGLDSSTNNIFSQIDLYNSSQLYYVVNETLFEISRGYHSINILANGKNPSSSNYFMQTSAFEFDLIQEYATYQDAKPAIESQGQVVLYRHVAAQNESDTGVINLTDMSQNNLYPIEKYEKIIIEMRGKFNGACILEMLLNGITTGYYQQGSEYSGGVQTLKNINNAPYAELLSTNLQPGANGFYVKIEIPLNSYNGNVLIFLQSCTDATNTRYTTQAIQVIGSFPLASVEIKTSASTWIPTTELIILGIKRI